MTKGTAYTFTSMYGDEYTISSTGGNNVGASLRGSGLENTQLVRMTINCSAASGKTWADYFYISGLEANSSAHVRVNSGLTPTSGRTMEEITMTVNSSNYCQWSLGSFNTCNGYTMTIEWSRLGGFGNGSTGDRNWLGHCR